MSTLLSKEHHITEKAAMEFQPFGQGPDGRTIYGLSGVVVKAVVEHLEDLVSQKHGADAGLRAVEELVRRLNARISDPAYHVTADFLKNPWNGYSSEFAAYNAQFCVDISEEPRFHFSMGKEKAISPIIQVLGRPFSVPQIYKMSAYFSQRYGKDSFLVDSISVSDRSAVLQMTFSDRICKHFGPYRRACAFLWCDAVKGYFTGVPEQFHNLPPAIVEDRRCLAEGDDYCEWVVTWSEHERGGPLRRVTVSVARHILRSEIEHKEGVMAEQVRTLDSRHVELQEAYVQQQQITAELQRHIQTIMKHVNQLTALNQIGTAITSTLDLDKLLGTVLRLLVENVGFARMLLVLYDTERQVAFGGRTAGVPEEVDQAARAVEIPIHDDGSLNADVLIHGRSFLIPDINEVADRVYPLFLTLARQVGVTSFVIVPLKSQERILGYLAADKATQLCAQEDLNLLVTIASDVAVAIDNARAYQQLEQLTQTLEQRVRERTHELQNANERLHELDELKSAFVSTVSHELRTPMTSIKGYVDNILDGLTGALTDRQAYYLNRVKFNIERLTRMINDLLDLSRIEAGRVEVRLASVCMRDLASEVVEGFQRSAQEKSVALHVRHPDTLPPVRGERDKLHQVLTNLLQNAVKFTPKGGRVEVESLVRNDGFVQISVSDTGCGIPPHELDLVFDRFYRGEAVPTENRGSGLGLPIAKSLVELHGGRIWAESVPGQGSRFFFTVPIEPSPPKRP